MDRFSLAQVLFPVMSMQYDVNDNIQKCIDKCIEEFWNASNYPRKKKKHVRKAMNAEYNMHLSCQSFMNEFGF